KEAIGDESAQYPLPVFSSLKGSVGSGSEIPGAEKGPPLQEFSFPIEGASCDLQKFFHQRQNKSPARGFQKPELPQNILECPLAIEILRKNPSGEDKNLPFHSEFLPCNKVQV